MAFPKFKIADDDGNVADVQSNRLDVNAHLSTTDNTVLDNIKSALDTIKVDTEAIETAVEGTLTTSTAITSIVPGTGPTNLGKQEDTAHSGGDLGVMALAVRKGTPADLSNADGDYEPLQLDEGRLWTSTVVTSVPTPTGGTVHSYGRFTAAETATAISDGTNGIAESVTDCKEIIIQPDSANSGFIRVGGLAGIVSGVPVSTSNGIRLDAGDTLVLPAASTDAVMIDGSAASQRVYVMLVR